MGAARVLGPQDGAMSGLGGVRDRFMIDGKETGGRFALVEHQFEPRALAAPMHRHCDEDEFTYVLTAGSARSWATRRSRPVPAT